MLRGPLCGRVAVLGPQDMEYGGVLLMPKPWALVPCEVECHDSRAQVWASPCLHIPRAVSHPVPALQRA